KSDPYIKVLFDGNQVGRTKKVADTLNAEYNEEFTFDFDPTSTETRKILLNLWDHDTFSDDDQIGYVEVRLKNYYNNKKKDQVKFKGVGKHEGKDVGTLDFVLEVRNKEQPQQQQPQQQVAQRKAKQPISQQSQQQDEQQEPDAEPSQKVAQRKTKQKVPQTQQEQVTDEVDDIG
ncbi:MAG: hypothetical protein EZS28_055035, partial [Streblomastix strix]